MSEFACCQQLLRLGSHEVAIENGAEAGRSDFDGCGVVENVVECLCRKLTETLKVVGRVAASRLLDDSVEVRLPCGSVDELGDRAAALQDGTMEETIMLAIVSDKLHTQRTGTSRLSPDSDLVGATAKGSHIVLDPLESKTLVLESDVAGTGGLHLLTEEETPVGEAVVDGHCNEGLVLLD
jgi:hypothetical protein